jgi:hypothetical protein
MLKKYYLILGIFNEISSDEMIKNYCLMLEIFNELLKHHPIL